MSDLVFLLTDVDIPSADATIFKVRSIAAQIRSDEKKIYRCPAALKMMSGMLMPASLTVWQRMLASNHMKEGSAEL
jgi:hypothetical protein